MFKHNAYGLQYGRYNRHKDCWETVISKFDPVGVPALYYVKNEKVLGLHIGAVDDGYLTNQHINIVRDYNTPNATLAGENRPDSRMAYGVVAQYNKLLTPDTAFIGSHRFYTDDWDISSHTLEADVYTNISKQFTLGAGLRYYTQTEANFYNGDMDYFSDETYASNDERLSDFDALTYKVNMNYKYNDLISYNLGVQLYQQNTDSDMSATTVTTGLKYRF